MKSKFIYFILLGLFISCSTDEITEKSVKTDSLEIRIGYKENTPIYQKSYKIDSNTILEFDSIKSDSMFTYADGKLVSKGKWKIEKNGQLIYDGWAFTYSESGEVLSLVEFSDVFIPETQFATINQYYQFNSGKIDSMRSRFIKFKKLENGENYIYLKSHDEKDMYKRSFLFGENLSNIAIENKELYDRGNVLSNEIKLLEGNRYEIWTFYLKNIKDSIDVENSTIMYFNYEPKMVEKSQKISNLLQNIVSK